MYEHLGKLIVALVVVLRTAAPATTHAIADNSRIFNGSDAKDMDTGFMVGMLFYGNIITCGGSIINKQTILTAAQCSTMYYLSSVHAGTKNSSLDQGLIKGIKDIHPHPNYNPISKDYDIALVRLESPLKFSSTIRPIKLADSGEALEEGSSATVFGWGITHSSDHSDKLLYKKVQIVKPKKCMWNHPYTDRMLCGDTGGLGPGPGDAGGPLVQNDKIIGIVSSSLFPVVYTRVAALRSWVDKTLAEHYNETL